MRGRCLAHPVSSGKGFGKPRTTLHSASIRKEMKKLTTTCYGRTRQLPPTVVQVQTSRMAPPYWDAEHKAMVWEFAPTKEILAASKRGEDWRTMYRWQLTQLASSGRLRELVEGLPDGAVLLCYEGDPKDCHRSILAEFINQTGLAIVTELPFVPKERKAPGTCSRE